MEYRRKHIVTAAITLMMFSLLILIGIVMKGSLREWKILTSRCGTMKVDVYMIGEPVTPYGETNCRIDLYEDGEKTDEAALSIQNYGEAVTKDNFLVEWNDDAVVIEAVGTEQEDISLKINY